MTNAALIAELESAQEGSPALDVAVYAALGHDLLVPIPCCTTDLQAAVGLVPEEMTWGVGWDWEIVGPWAYVGPANQTRMGRYGRSPALAMCIAILKAMETGDG